MSFQSMEPKADSLKDLVSKYIKDEIIESDKIASLVEAVTSLQNQIVEVTPDSLSFSPNTAGNPALLDRYPLKASDVKKMLQESAIQKAQGQAYAGKYSLTPQNFFVNSDGILKVTPYGNPPTDGKTLNSINNYSVPIVTDACYQYYDGSTGIHYRWDQFQADSQRFKGGHWFLDGPVVSVSLDGLKWVTLRTLLYDTNGGHTSRVGFWIDRDNRLGYGKNILFITDQWHSYVLPNLTASSGEMLNIQITPYGQDCRIYWDRDVVQGFLVLAVNGTNTFLIVRTGSKIDNIKDAYEFNDPIFSGKRVECPAWLTMFDQVTKEKTQVISVALQNGFMNETYVLGTCKYTVSDITMVQPFRQIEFGKHAYAQMLCDPLQQDGTGGTRLGCDEAVVNVGSYNWQSLNNATPEPSFGFAGGAWIPATLKVINGIPKCLPNDLFKKAMTGQVYKVDGVAQGVNPKNPNWLMEILTRCNVWRAELYCNIFSIPEQTTIRFHFNNRYIDYIIGNGVIDYIPNNSGSYVAFPNFQGGVTDNSTRRLPITQTFVTNRDNTLVWEYDNGRIRLYNINTGEYMSEIIFPDGNFLTAIEIFGDDLFLGGFTMTVNQDGGLNY